MSSTINPRSLCGLLIYWAIVPTALQLAVAQERVSLQPGREFEIKFTDAEVPPTLHTEMTGTAVPACLTIRLPEDYTPSSTFPLVVYVPGNDGGPKGNIFNARTIAGTRGWIAATLPLFKSKIDRSEPAGGVIVSFEDYPAISQAYNKMLGAIFDHIPNIERDRSAMVGFSNGAITVAILVSNHDEFVLSHFRKFCLVDQGMFHLTDLHKSKACDAKYLILVGDQNDMGRQQKIEQSQLLHSAWELLNVDVECRILKNTGHEFNEPQMQIVQDWLHDEAVNEPKPVTASP